MDRRRFFRNGGLFTLGATLINPFESIAGNTLDTGTLNKNKKAKNIIFMVSDGMSTGTLNMADLYLNRKTGKGSNWIQLYKDNRVANALMDTSSASSIITDSSAGSSSWGGGHKVKNGVLNIGPNGEKYMPIWQKFKKAGKMAGCVTTVPITHATPAGFCVNNDSRNAMEDIAEDYLRLGFDIMMGGGDDYFSADHRKDKKDMYAEFKAKGWQVARTRQEMLATQPGKPVLGVFEHNGLPYSIDRRSSKELTDKTPSLAEMAQKAIDHMKGHKNGFVLQIEGGKVDWGAHANDIAALLYDQVAFDEAVKAAIDFAEKDGNTLVVITTDHGNANPGVIYGKNANDNFDNIQKFTQTNEWILNEIKPDFTTAKVRELIEYGNSHTVTEEQAKEILSHYTALEKKEDGLYNYKNLPFKSFAQMQQDYTSVGWISMDHSADYVNLAMFGPGSELLKPFVKNTDLHYLMLQAAEVENKF
ncbi:alkaline phosphatase [Flavobacterium akiainvivens]|uniref:Alkaline phosphatase n=1 Tax=Flavobacterium akiainvivens TaxID=1202724 RepID=A0A0M9VI23_9FLAO|nr:alkaline phosphatase [Flavobacterium akiainvivens]KOS05959.1 alkaline phosphatase [Flavobacterium akiainvivens]SFQ53648.1 alkaline phosphatase [Flavobacterium akiainvivens]